MDKRIYALGVALVMLLGVFLQREPLKNILGKTEVNPLTVVEVVDGDTFKLANGETVRLIGIDTPETKDPRRPVGCYGKEAAAKSTQLLADQVVSLEKDVTDEDKYNRKLRYVWVGETFVNEYLVRNGYAFAKSYPPDIAYQDTFRASEREARENKRGLWGPVCADAYADK